MIAPKGRLFIFDTYSMESWKIGRRGNKYFASTVPCKTTIYEKQQKKRDRMTGSVLDKFKTNCYSNWIIG
jgi:hypothetical protein